jgi:hypothetical protein
MHTPKFLTALSLALALSLTGPGVMAKEKKEGGGKKQGSQKVVKRDNPRPSAQSSRGGGSSRHVNTVMRGPSRDKIQRSAPAQVSRKLDRSVDRQIASSNRGKSRADVVRRVEKAKNVPRSEVVSQSNKRDRSNIARSDTQVRDDTRVSRVRDSRSLSSEVRHRDRSHYERRHEHHDHDWYHSHGWVYDWDYYHSHHAHRYFNDFLGIFIFDTIGPSYAYTDGYSDYYGFDYETRLVVQQTLAEMGYYNGPIDGVIGPGTRAAIANYQADYGLAVTGSINNSLMQSMGIL